MGRIDKSNDRFINKSLEDEDCRKDIPKTVKKPKGKVNQIKFRTEEGLRGNVDNGIGLKG